MAKNCNYFLTIETPSAAEPSIEMAITEIETGQPHFKFQIPITCNKEKKESKPRRERIFKSAR